MAGARQLFVNIRVPDLQRAKAFCTALDFTVNPQCTDEHAAWVTPPLVPR